jgi:hypothetical protein
VSNGRLQRHKPRLVVEADGPLSVRCETCGQHIAGTQYPTVSFHLETLMTLLTIHAKKCGKKGAA